MKDTTLTPNRLMKLLLVLFTLAGLACATVQAQQSVQVISFTGTTWRYHTNNADQGTAWRAVTFNDSAAPWFSGQGVLGFEPANPQNYLPGFNTTFTAYTPAILTYYFRARFTNNLGPPLTLVATNLVDDGLMMYINGVEAGRIRMPAGQITWQTQANAQPTTEGQEDIVSIDPSLLRLGTNVIAVEVHQNGTGSSDVAFGMSMVATFPTFSPMSITAQPQNKTIPIGDDYTLSVGVSGGPGYFQWQANNGAGAFTNIPGAISATFTNRAAILGTNAYRVQVFNGTQTLNSTSAVVTVTLDTFGPRMLSAAVREETTRTNRIIVTWDEALTNSTVCVGCFTNFRVIMAASNIPVTISNMQYNPTGGAEFKPATILTMSTTNWFVGSNYWVIANNFRDFYTNVVAPNTIIGVSWPITTNVFTADTQAWDYHCNYVNDLIDRGIDIYTQNWTATNYDLSTTGWGGPALGLHQFDVLLTNASCFPITAINDISYQEQPTLFRSSFVWPASQATNVDLRFTYGADDGLTLFLNGSFLFKDNNFPTGPITAATRTGAESEGNCRTLVIPSVALRRGTNYLAVAVAQTDSDPADCLFGMNLDVIGLRTAPLPPNPTPSLSFARVGTNGFRLSWQTNSFGWALEYASTTNMGLKPVGTAKTNFLSGPWLEVQPRMANPYITNPVAGSHQIYRLRLKN